MSNIIELVLSAKDQASGAIDKVTDSLKGTEDGASKAGKALESATGGKTQVSLKGLGGAAATTAAAVLALGAAAVKGAIELGELAGQGQRDIRALNALGGAYAQVRAAVQDTLTVGETYRAQQTLLRSGLRVNGQELAALARYAREHGDANETSAESVQRFVESLREADTGGLRQFGLRIADGATRAQVFERALRQVTAANQSAAPVQRTLSEDATRLSSAMGEASTATAAWVAQGIGLQSFLSRAGDLVRGLTGDIQHLVEAQQRDAGTGTSAGEARIAAMREYSTVLQQVGQNLDEVGQRGALRTLTANPLSLSTEQLRAYSARLRALAARTGRFGLAVNAQGAIAAPTSGNLADLPEGTTLAALARQQNRQVRTLSAQDIAAELRGINTQAQTQLTERDRALRAAAGQGPRDTAGVGEAAAPLRAAQLDLGVQNQALAVMGERFRVLGQTITQEERLAALRAEAGRTAADVGENEASRLARVAAARGALLGALTEERDRRRELVQVQRTEAATQAQQALGALQTARAGGPQDPAAARALSGFGATRDRLAAVIEDQRQDVSTLTAALAAQNVPLVEQLRLRGLLTQTLQEQAQNEATLTAMNQRGAEAARASLDTMRAEVDAQLALQAAARSARDEGTALTRSETEADQNRVNTLSRLTELENGYRALVAQTTAEAAAAQTEEARNAALSRRLQLLGQLSQVESTRRDAQNQEARSNVPQQLSRRWNAALQSQTTQAERFSGAVADTFTSATDSFASHIIAVAQGQETFGEAMEGMLKDVLAMIAKRAIVEALVSTALGFGALASLNYPAAAQHFAAAGAWAVAGAAAVGGLAGLASGSGGGGGGAPAAGAGGGATAAPATTAAPASTGTGGEGGGLTLSVSVNGALFNEGVEDSVLRAIDRAALRGRFPRFVRRT